MKETKDFSDERLTHILGEAVGDIPSKEETLAAWNAFESKHVQEFTPNSSAPTTSKPASRAQVLGMIAATIAVAAALLVFFFHPSQNVEAPASSTISLYQAKSSPNKVEQTIKEGRCIVSTPASSTTLVTLEDGTKIMLNANTTLEYPQHLGLSGTREVILKGEAYFEVTKNPHRPFVVKAEGMSTQVLGTIFDVKAYQAEHPKVMLLEGKVKVSNAYTSTDIIPGQVAALQADKIIISRGNPTSTTDWLNGNFEMDQVSLAEAMSDIGAWYNRNVIIKSRKNLYKQIHFRFSRKASVEEVIAALNDMKIAKIEMHNGNIVVE